MAKKLKVLTFNNFKKWLESKAGKTKVGYSGYSERCPLSKFLTQSTGTRYVVGFKQYWKDSLDTVQATDLPRWASKFVFKVDEEFTGSVSAKRALRILQECA